MEEIINGYKCTITIDNIKIQYSYHVTDRKVMNSMLKEIKDKHPECKVFELRCWNNLISEWVAHNRLYFIGYKPEQTGSVDLDINEPWWHKVLYAIIGI